MKKTDMELQAIREKLRLLESEPPANDVLSMPWSSPQQSRFAGAVQTAQYTPATSAPTAEQTNTPQATVMETLRQRSVRQPAGHVPSSSTHDSETSRRADELVMQEIQRLEIHAHSINERSQKQAEEILAMKRSAQQAAVALRRQGISHPQLETIAQFLSAYPSAAVPKIDKDTQGQFTLGHTTVDLHRAEQEAINTAQTLRNLCSGHGPTAVPFTQPIASGPSVEEYLHPPEGQHTNTLAETSEPASTLRHKARRKRSSKRWAKTLLNVLAKTKSQQQVFQQTGAKTMLAGSVTNGQLSSVTDAMPAHGNERFSWMDGAIWFSGAAIARFILEAVVISYPIVRMPLMLILFSIISFSIYRVFVSKSSDLSAAYRLGVVLLGLFLGSAF